jgi:hypothetical protein
MRRFLLTVSPSAASKARAPYSSNSTQDGPSIPASRLFALTLIITTLTLAGLLASPALAETLKDGAAHASAGAAQHAFLLDSYKARPGWRVAGVDYAVGVAPGGGGLKDPVTCHCLPAGAAVDAANNVIRITGNNVTLDGFNFGLHGGMVVSVEGGADKAAILNSSFDCARWHNPAARGGHDEGRRRGGEEVVKS